MSDGFPDTPHTRQSIHRSSAPNVLVGGTNTGPINITYRQKLNASRIPHVDIQAAVEPLWADTPTPYELVNRLRSHGIAVIEGDHGSGRRISAVRSLHLQLSNTTEKPRLHYLSADWDENEDSPPRDILPDTDFGHGYIIDASSHPLTDQACHALTSWAEDIHQSGAALVVIGNKGDWRGDTRFVIPAISPDPIQVARNHLAERLAKPIHAGWLQPDSNRSNSRWPRVGSSGTRTVGIFADIINRNVSPSDAVAIAERMQHVDPQRVDDSVTRENGQGARELREIREEILLWKNFLENILTADDNTRGEDRVMLLAAAYLEGAPLELCIKAASEFSPNEDPASRRIRQGRSPRRRMVSVGVDITSDDRAAFERMPHLAIPAIRIDWLHWTNERRETKDWLERITASGGIAAGWIGQIGERILHLSRTVPDPPFFSVIDTWAAVIDESETDRLQVVTELMTNAAEVDELARETHKRLIEWSSQRSSLGKRLVVASVCRGSYGKSWPRTALTRLRHILAWGDSASEIAIRALIDHAISTSGGLKRIIETVDDWIHKYPTHSAGPRAFLALADYSRAPGVLSTLITMADTEPAYRDFLTVGWDAALGNRDLQETAYEVLVSWSRAVHENELNRNSVFGIISDVRSAHTPVDAMSRFLYGNRDTEDPALVEARFALANIPRCEHTQCDHPNCPLKEEDGGGAQNDEGVLAGEEPTETTYG